MKSLPLLIGVCFAIASFFFISCKKDTPWAENTLKGTIIEGAAAIITQNTEWKDLYGGDTIDYYVNSMVRIQGNAILTIKPGVKVSFENPEAGIRVEDKAGLNAIGNSIKPIIFTSRTDTMGAWKGIIFASGNISNQLDYVYLEFAGSKNDDGYCDAATSVGLAKNKKVMASITNSIIRESGGYGLWAAGSSDITLNFAKDTIRWCSKAPIAITSDNMVHLDSISSFNSNIENYIDVYCIDGAQIANDAILQHLDVPYRITGRILISKTLTISPGCILEFNPGGEITTTDLSGSNYTGNILAAGNGAPYKIIFRGVQSQPGSWVGITITSPNVNNFFNCEISDGGGATGYQNPVNAKGNIIVGRNGMGANATIKNCKIFNGSAFGIAKYVDALIPANSSTVTTQNVFMFNGHPLYIETNTFDNNTLGNIGNY